MTPDTHNISNAAARLRQGGLVAFPTETVYGLGADATSPEAVARIFAAKGRPRFNPLIAHVASVGDARTEGVFTRDAERLADQFWPGPLTLVLPRQTRGAVCDLACAGLASVGLRVPGHRVALHLLKAFGRPLAAPSANRSGRLSPTSADDVRAELGTAADLVLDGGRCAIGLESTIIACIDDRVQLLRAGGISREAVEAAIGGKLAAAGPGIRAPGQIASHYAPVAPLRLDAQELQTGETGLDFGRRLPGAMLDLSSVGDLREAAANLYRHIRTLDSQRVRTIAVAPIPEEGLGLAINDRLRRAAAPREPAST